jgi:hypothetical protein
MKKKEKYLKNQKNQKNQIKTQKIQNKKFKESAKHNQYIHKNLHKIF